MRKKKKIYTGYAVVSRDRSGCSFEGECLETCKRYCRHDDIIVRKTRYRFGYGFRICWYKWYKPFQFRWRWRECNILKLHIRWEVIYGDKWDGEVVWESEKKEE